MRLGTLQLRRTYRKAAVPTTSPSSSRHLPAHGRITGPELATADAYATAAFAMGTRGPAWTARLRGYEAMTILADERVLSTPGFPA
jgi:thiamine biosynthesis lipoprotein ApbE